MNSEELWSKTLELVEQEISKASYGTWFGDTKVKELNKNQLIVEVSNEFQRDWLYEYYHILVEEVVNELTEEIMKVVFVARETENRRLIGMNKKRKSEKVFKQGLTYDDYVSLRDDGMRYELADGVLESLSQAPNPIYQLVSSEIYSNLKQSCQNEYIIFTSLINVILAENEVRQPDIVVIHQSKVNLVTSRGIEGSPDLVIEVLSPSTIKRDREDKRNVYATYGIQEYWLVDPVLKTLEQYILEKDVYVLDEVYLKEEIVSSTRFPCVSFSMDDIFKQIPVLPNA